MSNSTDSRNKKRYTIYCLIDPRDGSIYYVGCTTNLPRRSATHLTGSDTTTARLVTADILAHGIKPAVEILDTIEHADKGFALYAEAYWREEMRNRGEPLTNKWDTGFRMPYGCKNPMEELAKLKSCLSMTWAEYTSAEMRRKKIKLDY